MRGGYLHQHCPDVIPHGRLTDEEVSLWCAFFEMQAAEQPASAKP